MLSDLDALLAFGKIDLSRPCEVPEDWLNGNAELLTGEVQAADLDGFEWREPIRLPWGERRYLWIGKH